MTRLLGFDRLQEAGFNEEEIRDIRVQFHRLHGSPNFDGGKLLAFIFAIILLLVVFI